jgi:hypothetical protein
VQIGALGRLTPEMKQRIVELYSKYLSYERVASELNLDWRTAKRVILAKAETHDENSKSSTDSGENYPLFFQDFRDGKSQVDLVIQRGVSPESAKQAFEKYQEAEEALVLSKEQKKRNHGVFSITMKWMTLVWSWTISRTCRSRETFLKKLLIRAVNVDGRFK